MSPVVLTGLVTWVSDSGLAAVRVGQGILVLFADGLAEGDLLELRVVPGSTYTACSDPRANAHRWVLLTGPCGPSAITVPRGTDIPSTVDLLLRQVDLETSEGFDTDPDTSDQSVPAAGLDVGDIGDFTTGSSAAPLPQ